MADNEDSEAEAPDDTGTGPERQGTRERQTQRERRARSERRIVSATLRMIARRGVARTTLAEVGELAGYSRGLPAHLFGSKDNLLRECLKRLIVDYWIEDLPEARGEGAFRTLCLAIRKWLDDLEGHPEFSRAYYLLLLEANFADGDATPELVSLVRQVSPGGEARFRDYLRAGQEAGEVRADIDPELQAMLIHTTLRGVGLRWMIDPSQVDLQEFGRRFTADLEQRLLPGPEAPRRT